MINMQDALNSIADQVGRQQARLSFFDGVTEIMRANGVGLDEALRRFHALAFEGMREELVGTVPADRIDGGIAHMEEAFQHDAQHVRRMIDKARALIRLADQ